MLHPIRTITALLVLVLLAGCGPQQRDTAPDPADTLATSDEAVPANGNQTDPSGASQARPGVPLSELVEAGRQREPGQQGLPVLDRLNEPARLETEPRENRHVPGQVDTLRTYHYDGLRFEVYDVSDSERQLMQNVTVMSDAYDPGLGFRVGSTRSEVEAAMGEPGERRSGAYVYDLGESELGASDQLIVRFDGDRVRELEWSFYVD